MSNELKELVWNTPVSFSFDGEPFSAPEGQSVAVALMAAGRVLLRTAPCDDAPRGMFCCMGICQECLVSVQGRYVEACRLPGIGGA